MSRLPGWSEQSVVSRHAVDDADRWVDQLSASSVVVATIRELHPRPLATIGPETELGAAGLGLDSIAVLELVLALEARLGARFRNEDLDERALRTVGGLVAYVDAHVV